MIAVTVRPFMRLGTFGRHGEKAKDVLMKIEEGIPPIYAKQAGLGDEDPLSWKLGRGCCR